MDRIQKFKEYFEEFGFETDTKVKDRVKGKKKLDTGHGMVNVNLYYYDMRNFYKYNKDTDGFDSEVLETVPALMMYASGLGLCGLGIQNLELRTIKNPNKEDIEKLEDYLRCLLILLK